MDVFFINLSWKSLRKAHCTKGDLKFGQGSCLTGVTQINRHDLLLWFKPNAKNIKWFCNDVMAIDFDQFGNIHLL